MRWASRIIAAVIGAAIISLAVIGAVDPEALYQASATQPDDPAARVSAEPTWYATLARYVGAALLAFFGVTILLAPWRGAPGRRRGG